LLLSPQLERVRVVLVATRNPLNIGAAARAMSNFGFSGLRLVRPYGPSFREARSAVGAAALLAQAETFSTVADAVADCSLVVGTTAARNRELLHPLYRLEHAGKQVRKRLASGRVAALLFGSEKTGLTSADLSHCHCLLHIPTSEANLSMNLGQAVAVCLYELVRATRLPVKQSLAGMSKTQAATTADLERLTAIWCDVLARSGYFAGRNPPQESDKVKLRRQIRRLALTSDDAQAWLGMFRQVRWKMQ
jgi:tRNA/rRNA methyltransferase